MIVSVLSVCRVSSENAGTDVTGVRGDDPCRLAPPSWPNPAPCARIRVSGVFGAHAEICGVADDSGEIAVLQGDRNVT